MTTFTGTIKWFNETKGFGFINPDAGGEDIFLHITNFIGGGMGDIPQEGQTVTYQIGHGKSGKKEAWNVERVTSAPKVGRSKKKQEAKQTATSPKADNVVFGTVKFFNWNDDKLYGFVKVKDLNKDVFLHHSQLTGLSDEEKVRVDTGTELVFTLKRSKKGYYAQDASLLDPKVVRMKHA